MGRVASKQSIEGGNNSRQPSSEGIHKIGGENNSPAQHQISMLQWTPVKSVLKQCPPPPPVRHGLMQRSSTTVGFLEGYKKFDYGLLNGSKRQSEYGILQPVPLRQNSGAARQNSLGTPLRQQVNGGHTNGGSASVTMNGDSSNYLSMQRLPKQE
jgi:hypothetical protein